MRILVTGGGGFLGGAIVQQLLERGDEVTTLSRSMHANLQAIGVEQKLGDLGDSSAVRRAVEGCAQVIHVASKVGAWGPSEAFEATNVVGTDNVLAACLRAGVESLVYTSSPSVICSGADIEGGDESLPYPADYEADYPRTKAIAERAVLAADAPGFRTVALRPHIVWGPRDTSLVARVVARARAGKLRRFSGPEKLIDVCYVDDAARAHLLAGACLSGGGEDANRVGGKAYFITSGVPVETWTMIDRIVEAAGLPKIEKTISPRMARLAGGVLESLYRAVGREREPMMTRWVAQELATAHWFDITAARRDLGYEPRVSLDEGMKRLRVWLATAEI